MRTCLCIDVNRSINSFTLNKLNKHRSLNVHDCTQHCQLFMSYQTTREIHFFQNVFKLEINTCIYIIQHELRTE